jgi:hypothetical protein
MAIRPLLAAACVAPLLLLATPAVAQDVAAAEALFNKGVADMDAGRYDAACPAIAESQRLDPRPGTLFAQSECNAKAGKIASAIALYEDYLRTVGSQPAAVKAKHADRLKIARAQIDKLRPAVPTLTLTLPPGAPSDARVRRDGTVLSAAALGVALPVDPGEHVVVVEAPGRRPAEQRIVLDRSQKKVVELALGGAADAGAPPPAAGPVTPEAPAAPASNAQRVSGFVVGGVGAATLLLGAVTGGLTLAKKSTITANCSGTVCNHDGKAAADSARTTGLVSTIGFAAGGAALVTGVVLLLTAPKKSDEKSARYDVEIGPNGFAMNVKGVW